MRAVSFFYLLWLHRKVHPSHGVYVWWQNVFSGDPTIDTASIEGRQQHNAESMQATWDEAMRMFRERRRKEKESEQRVEIDNRTALAAEQEDDTRE